MVLFDTQRVFPMICVVLDLSKFANGCLSSVACEWFTTDGKVE